MNPHYNWILEGSSFHNLELFHLRTLRTCFYIEENSHSNRQVKSNPKDNGNKGELIQISDEEENRKSPNPGIQSK